MSVVLEEIEELKDIPREYLHMLREFRLLDDDYMTKFFEDNIACTELLLHIILENDTLKVEKVSVQHTIKNLKGRSVRLDVFATDADGKKYDIEIQRTDRGAGAKRARYNSSVIDADSTVAGEDTDQLVENYVIFITENDVLGYDLPIYHIERVICENGVRFNDGSHIIYVNGAHTDDTPLGLLMQDFRCKKPSDMHYALFAEQARYLKETTEGVRNVCRLMEDYGARVAAASRQEGEYNNKITTARRMLAAGKLSFEEIAEYTSLTVEEIRQLAENKSA